MKPEQTTKQNLTDMMPWLLLFRTFSLALDSSKLALGALGILATAIGWAILSFVFSFGYESKAPQWSANSYSKAPNPWSAFKTDRERWNLMHLSSGVGGSDSTYEIEDLVENEQELQIAKDANLNKENIFNQIGLLVNSGKINKETGERLGIYLGQPKPRGLINTMPWFEERGPNPYLLATGQAGVPWNVGRFWDWVITQQCPYLLEPLVKAVRPALLLIHPEASFTQRVYFIGCLAWILVVWSFFGGAISRIVVVQIARNENIGMRGALKFAQQNMVNLISAPLFCPTITLVLLLVSMAFGLLGLIPIFGDIFVSGLFWGVFMGLGLVMALVLVGLVGWPLMVATVSSEGLDSWESFSRGIQYLYSRPWNFIAYNLVTMGYGIVAIFFIGFMASFGVYLAKWSVANTPMAKALNRSPEFLFVYSPTSFGWRELLLQGGKVDGQNLVVDGKVDTKAYQKYLGFDPQNRSEKDSLRWYNFMGAGLVAIWLGAFFLLVVGFGYSYFWVAFTLIFLLLRKDLDNNEIHELHLEEDEETLVAPVLEKAPREEPQPETKSRSLPVVDAPPSKPESPEV